MRQIELAEIASSTKISRRYLEAFEQDRFDQLPAPIFARGFLREYAKFIGVDPDEAVTHYLSAVQAMAPDDEDDEPTPAKGAVHSGSGGHWVSSLLIVLAVAGALLAVYLLSYRAATRQREGRTTSPAATSAEPSTPDARPAEPPPSAPAGAAEPSEASPPPGAEIEGAAQTADPGSPQSARPPLEPAADAAPIQVTLAFRRDCWVEVRVDNRRSDNELRRGGESLQITAERLVEMKVGDAGAVDVRVNGRPYSLGRGSGQVARARIDLDTVEALTGVS